MTATWDQLVAGAVAGPADDAYVQFLRERLAAGARVIRVNFVPDKAEYQVLLEQQQHLTPVRVPHCDSFTRWSFTTGRRMASVEEEIERLALVLRERFEPTEAEVGRDYLQSALWSWVREASPPRTSLIVQQTSVNKPNPGHSLDRARVQIETIITELATALGRGLGYENSLAGDLLDRSLGVYIDRHFHFGLRKSLLRPGER